MQESKRLVVKYGGNAMVLGAPDPTLDEIADLYRAGIGVVLVHGGGPMIDAELRAGSIGQTRIAGLRVTDAPSLTVVERILCATVNKALVRALARAGVKAVGISGQDGGMMRADYAQAEGRSLGFVGDVPLVDTALIQTLLSAGFLPVIAPVAVDLESVSALNVNADSAAGAIAGALQADAYVVITNVARVLRDVADPASGLSLITAAEASDLIADGTFADGMRPKILGALDALRRGARRAIITGAEAGAIAAALAGAGTEIVA